MDDASLGIRKSVLSGLQIRGRPNNVIGGIHYHDAIYSHSLQRDHFAAGVNIVLYGTALSQARIHV